MLRNRWPAWTGISGRHQRNTHSITNPWYPTVDLTWDAQGNLASRGGLVFSFDYSNRLRSVAGRESYRYDGLGRRVLAWDAQGGQDILSMYSRAGQLVYQWDGRAQTRHAYVHLGKRLIAIVDLPFSGGSSVRYQHIDYQGTVVAQTNAGRGVLTRSVYDSYGAPRDHGNDDNPGYTGHLQDSLTGLTYMQQRYYDPAARRFLSVDPVGVDGTSGGNFNRYWYANDNPYRYTDPDGRLTGSLLKDSKFLASPVSVFGGAVGTGSKHQSASTQSSQRSAATNPESSQQAKPKDRFQFDSLFTGDKKPTFSGVAAYGLGIVAHKTPGPGNDEVAFTPAGLGLEATATWHLADFKFNFSNAKTSPAYVSAFAGRAGLGLVVGIEIRYTPPGKLDIDITGGFGAAADAHLFDIGTKVDHSDGN